MRQVAWLKQDRDRYVAFAFCSADVLVETDTELRIVYATGASGVMFGTRPEDLIGAHLPDLVDDADVSMFKELTWAMHMGSRVGPANFRFRVGGDRTRACSVSGYRLEDLPGSFFFALREPQAVEEAAKEIGRDVETGLLERETFTRLATEKLKDARDGGKGLNLTLVHVPAMHDLWSRLDQDAAGNLAKTLGACMRLGAGSEEIAGRFDDERFGFLHGADVDVDAIQARMEEHLRTADPEGVGTAISAGTVPSDVFETDDADAVKALAHTINQFCQTSASELTAENASATVERLAKASSERLATFRTIVSSLSFKAAFHPIVNIQDMRINHYEALVRFDGAKDASPYELIEFAENAGLIPDFDIAMCRKVLAFLRQSLQHHEEFHVSVNVSGRSISDPTFRGTLRELLKEFADVRRQLMIEITESFRIVELDIVNNFIQEMRAAGHLVCLDDFGAGSSAMSYLSAMDVDIVKIDGAYIVEALGSEKQFTLLRHVAAMCKELGIETVAERVEHGSTLDMLRRCGIGYAQGFLFGMPNTDIYTFGEKRLGDPARHIMILG